MTVYCKYFLRQLTKWSMFREKKNTESDTHGEVAEFTLWHRSNVVSIHLPLRTEIQVADICREPRHWSV